MSSWSYVVIGSLFVDEKIPMVEEVGFTEEGKLDHAGYGHWDEVEDALLYDVYQLIGVFDSFKECKLLVQQMVEDV